MKRNFTHITDLNKINSITDILSELGKHEEVLVGTNIGRLVYFSRTYAIVNRQIYLARLSGYFYNPELMHQLQINFARLYFETLNEYAATGYLPRQWKTSVNGPLVRLRPAGFSLFLATKAHIECDVVVALDRLMIDHNVLAQDYCLINKIILLSSREAVKLYNPNPKLGPIRELARKLLIWPICFIIFSWRKNAWRRFSTSRIESNSKYFLHRFTLCKYVD